MTTDPAHRHGGPDAGWYRPHGHGWQRISDVEAANERYDDMVRFGSDPNGRHDPATVAGMEPGVTISGGNGAPEKVAADGRAIIGGGGAGESTTFGPISAGGGASPGTAPGGGLGIGRVTVTKRCGSCGHVMSDHGQKPPAS